MSVAPRKKLSQNFLTNQAVARRIVDSLDISNKSTVVEIGPGTGALTRWLAESAAKRIVAIDVDERAIQHCNTQPWMSSKVQFVHADIRACALTELVGATKAQLIGNLPYGLSSEILFWILEHRAQFTNAVVMLQREVARRLVALPGSKEYGILSVALWFGTKAELLFTVQPGSFFPKPSVVSAVVSLKMRDEPPLQVDEKQFQTFVRAAFSQRRKVLSNSLKSWAGQRRILLADDHIPLEKTRAEELTPMQLAELFSRLETSFKRSDKPL